MWIACSSTTLCSWPRCGARQGPSCMERPMAQISPTTKSALPCSARRRSRRRSCFLSGTARTCVSCLTTGTPASCLCCSTRSTDPPVRHPDAPGPPSGDPTPHTPHLEFSPVSRHPSSDTPPETSGNLRKPPATSSDLQTSSRQPSPEFRPWNICLPRIRSGHQK